MISPAATQKRLGLLVIVTLSLLIAAAHTSAEEPYLQNYEQDIRSILQSRDGMKSILTVVDTHPEIFLPAEPKVIQQLNRQQRILAWQTWQSLLDHILFLDLTGNTYNGLFKNADTSPIKKEVFLPAFACFLAQYRFTMEYIDRVEKNPDMDTILNDEVPEYGLEQGMYAKVKFRFLNVIRGAEFVRLNIIYNFYKRGKPDLLTQAIDEDIAAIWRMGKGHGPALTAQNALKIVSDIGFTAWFPVQKNVSELMGEIKVWRPGVSLISINQIRELEKTLQPGDILLQRREWYATNIGIPGFWTHAALYIGDPKKRAAYFSSPAIEKWLTAQGSVDGSLDSLLQQKFPDKYHKSTAQQDDTTPPRVLEAISEGVSFTTLEHSGSADSMVVLRPNLPRESIAQAIIKAFHYSGRPYDFNFDFRTDSELVCSELIYKAYERTATTQGLSLPLTETLKRPLLAPNQIARLFDEEYGTSKQQLTFVAFLDGSEKKQKASHADLHAFRQSWKRPKWHILLQQPQ